MAERSANLDRLRLVAVVGVAHFHITRELTFLGVSLPIFLLLGLALPLRAPAPPPLRPFLERRVRRLLLPFLFWSLVYAPLLTYYPARYDLSLLFAGTWGHLWFLPCLFAAGILSLFVLRRVTRPVAILLALLTLLLAQRTENYLHPERAYLFALPALFLACLLARAMRTQAGLARCAAAGLLLGVGGALYREFSPFQRYGFALLLVALALRWPGRDDRVTPRLTAASYGIYLLHPAVDLATNHPLRDWGGPGRTAAVLLLSYGLTEAMLASRVLRRFV